MIKIELIKEVKTSFSQLKVNKIAKAVFIQVKKKKNWQVTLAIVGDKRMKELNKNFRGKDKVTDVLSFSALDEEEILPGAEDYLGDVVISLPQVKRQAKQFGVSLDQEFTLLLVHGLLHLLGYDHETNEKDAKKMERLQNKMMIQFGFSPDLRYN